MVKTFQALSWLLSIAAIISLSVGIALVVASYMLLPDDIPMGDRS